MHNVITQNVKQDCVLSLSPKTEVYGKMCMACVFNEVIGGNVQGHPTEVFRKISVPQWKFSWLGN